MSLRTVDSTLLASLPSELHLLILEHAACASVPTALALSLVSRWVNTLTQPYLYHTVVLSTSRALASFHTTLSSKPHHFANTHVKHLGIFAPGPVETVAKVLNLCQRIDSLACGFSLPAYKELQAPHPQPPVQPKPLTQLCPASTIKEQHLLSLSCRDGWDVSLVSPSVTHLRVHITSPQRPWFAMPGAGANTTLEASNWDLSYLPHLTHLGIVWKPAKGQKVEDVLVPLTRLLAIEEGAGGVGVGAGSGNDKSTSKLQVILIQILGTRISQASAVKALNDAALKRGGSALRIVAEAAPLSAVSQWEDGVRRGEGRGVWEDAEGVVCQRLVGEVSKS